MKNLNPTQVAQNWANGMASSTDKMKQGIQAVTEAPAQKAIRAIPRMIEGIQRAAANGTIQAGLEKVTLPIWQKQAIEVGIPRVAAGAAAAKPKFAAFMTEFIPHLQQGVQALESMPRGDLETNLARATQMMRWNAQFKLRNR